MIKNSEFEKSAAFERVHTRATQDFEDCPEYVKAAQISDVCPPEETPVSQFADVSNQKYPCHTKAATWLSYYDFLENSSQHDETARQAISGRLEKYASYWGIYKDAMSLVRDYSTLAGTDVDDCLPDTAFAYIDKAAGVRTLPVTRKTEAAAAIIWLEKHANGHWDVRNQIATRLLNRMDELNIEIPEKRAFLERVAGRGFSDKDDVVRAIKARIPMIKGAALQDRVRQLADHVGETYTSSLSMVPENSIKIAGLLYSVDQDAGIRYEGKNAFQRPEDIFFAKSVSEIDAEKNAQVTSSSGHLYRRDELKGFPRNVIQDAYGDEVAEKVSTGITVDPEKLANYLQDCPVEDAEDFNKLASGRGIIAAGRAESKAIGFSNQELSKIGQLVNQK